MPDILAVATLKRKTNVVADDIVNTFAFSMPSGFNSSHYDTLTNAVVTFYNFASTGMSSGLYAWMSEEMSTTANANTVDLYDITGHLDGSPHGSPIYTDAWGLSSPAASTPMPSEVCVAVTLLGNGWASTPVETPDGADPGTAVDRLRQRKTGKLYIGPFSTSAITEDPTTNVAKVNATLSADIRASCDALAANARAVISGGVWCVWSRADEFLYTITHVQCDREFDTQRRRGIKSAVRDQTDVSS